MSLTCNGIGIGVIRSIAIGEAWQLQSGRIEARRRSISAGEVKSEKARFRQAVEAARQDLKAVRDQIPKSTPTDISAFIDKPL